jgi:hypothetical protein
VIIEKFLGIQPSSVSLSPRKEQIPGTVGILAGAVALQPGESLIVPLRLNFEPYLDPSDPTWSADQRANAHKRYQAIQASKPGTIFHLEVETELTIDQRRAGKDTNIYTIVKTRESFTPHSEPDEEQRLCLRP